MKKILFSVLAVAALASCTNDQTIATPKGAAIAFDNVWVDNATRATDINAGNLTDFGVYASVKAGADEGLMMKNVTVTKQQNGTYTYQNTQYWVPNTTYSFAAIAPKTNANWAYTTAGSVAHAGTISFNNEAAKANQDLIYAFESRSLAAGALTEAPSAVGFTFNHLLARVRFTFVNAIAAGSNITVAISNVRIADAYKKGTLAVVAGEPATNWVVEGKNLNVPFATEGAILAGNGGNETTEHHYLIPAYDTYTINFDVTVYQAGVKLDTYARTATVRLDMQKGNSYDIKAALTTETVIPNPLFPIEFTVTKVEDWSNYTDVEAAVVEEVATADELVEAIAAGSNVVLTQDITLSGTELNIAEGEKVVVDLGNKTLTVNALDPIENEGVMTLTNGKIVGVNAEQSRRCVYNYGTMTIDGVEFVQTYDKKGAAINNAGVMVINDATVTAAYFGIWNEGQGEITINGGSFVSYTGEPVQYCLIGKGASKYIINGGSFQGDHGVVACEEQSSAVINGGKFYCTASATGNSDWVFYADPETGASISYNAANCELTTNNPNGAIYGSVTTL